MPQPQTAEPADRYHDYIVLYHDGDHLAFEGISLNRRPKGKPKEVAFALATILGLDHSKVVGVLHITPGIEVKLSKCGMEMLFTLSK
jgi:hypothetical protein